MIVDAHIHMLQEPDFCRRLLTQMDAAGIARANLVALWPAGFVGSVTAGNAEVRQAVRRHPDRFTGFAYVDPCNPDAPAQVRELAETGFHGFKLFPPCGYRMDEDRIRPALDAMAASGRPLLVHCGLTNLDLAAHPHTTPINSALARPIYIDSLTRLYPHTAFIVAHMGFPFLLEAWSLAMANSNVILDVAGGPVWPWSWVDIYANLGRPVPIDWDRVWWGTDNCMGQAEGIAFARKRLLEAGCPEAKLASCLGGCACRLLGIR